MTYHRAGGLQIDERLYRAAQEVAALVLDQERDDRAGVGWRGRARPGVARTIGQEVKEAKAFWRWIDPDQRNVQRKGEGQW
jgi:hypothetical protein